MILTVNQEQLIAMLANHICEASAGMLLDAKIAKIEAIDQAGRAFPLDKIVVELEAHDQPLPKPVEYQTPTGRVMRLATVEGRAVG